MDKIQIAAQALVQADEAHSWLSEHLSKEVAETWYGELFKQIGTLTLFPTRCPVAPESGGSSEVVRELAFGIRRHPHNYRILFVVRDEVVVILHVHRTSPRVVD
ncbi:type II toxin-antitoxin system RelE/ParE family toxin [Isosphaeraceae bacterium EP7]